MRILMTGGNGFIGQHLRPMLEEKFTGGPMGLWTPREEAMDLRFPDDVGQYILQTRPDVIIHLAAKSEVAHSFANWDSVLKINMIGTAAVAEAAAAVGAHLIFASTMETYGHAIGPFDVADEETEQRPIAPYAVAKVAAEKYIQYLAYAKDLNYTILRQTNTYGRTNTDFFVVERIVYQMVASNRGWFPEHVMLGAGWPERNFLYIDDLVSLYEAVLNNLPMANREVFVTGPENAITIFELAELIQELTGFKGTIKWDTIPPRPGEVPRLNSRPDKALAMLGWEPKVELREGLMLTIEKWRNR